MLLVSGIFIAISFNQYFLQWLVMKTSWIALPSEIRRKIFLFHYWLARKPLLNIFKLIRLSEISMYVLPENYFWTNSIRTKYRVVFWKCYLDHDTHGPGISGHICSHILVTREPKNPLVNIFYSIQAIFCGCPRRCSLGPDALASKCLAKFFRYIIYEQRPLKPLGNHS